MKTFICAKGTSIRCPNKNIVLLPYVLEQVTNYLDIVVITDSQEIVNICKQHKVSYYIEDKECQKSEFHSVWNFIKNKSEDEFIILPLTQPFRNKSVIEKVIEHPLKDVVTTYTIISNRALFLLNDDCSFKHDSYNRKGSMCKKEKMIDGSIYKMTKNFLQQIIESKDANHEFWNNSSIDFVENDTDIFLDVDTIKDLNVFHLITNNKYKL